MMEQDDKKGPIARDETFDEFLAREGMLAETEELVLKEIIADQIREAMKANGITKTAMAARMKADRRQLDRLLDPANPSVTLSTRRRAASAAASRGVGLRTLAGKRGRCSVQPSGQFTSP